MGHVRDLPSKNGSVLPDEDFKMVYEVKKESKKHVDNILAKSKDADVIYLASDPDREGEAIVWN
jgi:DNA topoisomerase-1